MSVKESNGRLQLTRVASFEAEEVEIVALDGDMSDRFCLQDK